MCPFFQEYCLASCQSRNERRRFLRIFIIANAEFRSNFTFLPPSKSHIDKEQDRKHEEGEDRGPHDKKAQHDHQKTGILGMTNVCVWSGRGQGMRALCGIEYFPGPIDDKKAAEDQNIAYDMDRVEVRVALKTENRLPEMTAIVCQEVRFRKATLQPAGKQIDGQGEAVHLGEHSQNKG